MDFEPFNDWTPEKDNEDDEEELLDEETSECQRRGANNNFRVEWPGGFFAGEFISFLDPKTRRWNVGTVTSLNRKIAEIKIKEHGGEVPVRVEVQTKKGVEREICWIPADDIHFVYVPPA